LLRFAVFFHAQYLRASIKFDNFKLKRKDRPVTQGSVCSIWMRRFITIGVVTAVGVSVVESMTHGLFASGLSALVSASTAASNNVVTAKSLGGYDARQQRPARASEARRDDDGYVEGLAATLGYQSPELMATGSIGSGHTMAER
jgi:hypothetical protein